MEVVVEQNNNNSSSSSSGSSFVKMSPPPPMTIDIGSCMITLRMIMQGKEVGSIIGKKGDNVKRFREESGARINISDASCPERIVTISGTTDQVVSAFTMICQRFEEDLQNSTLGGSTTKQLITLRLIIPANQCGSLIGKGGAKIKEIRDTAGASIQISSEMLPNSTERLVTVSGSVDSITRGIYHICTVMLESPPKGSTIPYRPKLAMTPAVILAGGQAFTMQGQYFIPQPDLTSGHPPAVFQYQPMPQFAKMIMQQGMMGHTLSPYSPQQTILAPSYQCGFIRAPPSAQQGLVPQQHATTPQTHEVSIPNDLIGCIIGRGGSKINEIRQASGANIKIASVEDGCSMRMVTITGAPEAINAAQYLINASIEMHKNLNLALTYDPNSDAASQSDQCLSVNNNNIETTVDSLTYPRLTPDVSSAINPVRMTSTALTSVIFNSNNRPNLIASSTSLTPDGSQYESSNVNLSPQQAVHYYNPLTLNPGPSPSTFTIPFNPLIRPIPVLGYHGNVVGTAMLDPRRNVATKIKGGFNLTTVNGQKFSPY